MIIGLTGYAGSGKDAVASFLTERFGFVRLAFADKVRDELYADNPLLDIVSVESDDERAEYPIFLADIVDRIGWDEAKQLPDVRARLQELGTKRRDEKPDYWITKLDIDHWFDIDCAQFPEAARAAGIDKPNLVFTDVRFRNEAEWLKERDAAIVRVNRPGVGPINAHESETEMDDWPYDYVIHNDGTLEELGAAALILKRLTIG